MTTRQKTQSWILLIAFFLLGETIRAQPLVGEEFPNVTWTDIQNHTTKSLSTKELKGKWLFLDFWSLACNSCVESFPKINRLHQEFESRIQFLLVGNKGDSYNRNIETVFARMTKHLKLTVPSAFDSVIFGHWKIRPVPRIYLIDPEGIVRYITDGRDLTSEKVGQLLEGHPVSFFSNERSDSRAFDMNNYYKTENLLTCSALTKWTGEVQRSGYEIDLFEGFSEKYKKDGWLVTMAPLYELYLYAYFGRFYWSSYDTAFYGKVYALPVLDLTSSSAFEFDATYDVGKGFFNYYLKTSLDNYTKEYICQTLQNDLSNVFGYEASIVHQEMPVWRLVAHPGAQRKLKSKGGSTNVTEGSAVAGFTVNNYGIKNFLNQIVAYLPNPERLAYVDATGISYPIDATISANMTDFASVQKALRKYDLELIRGTKKMKTLMLTENKGGAD